MIVIKMANKILFDKICKKDIGGSSLKKFSTLIVAATQSKKFALKLISNLVSFF